MSRIINVNDLTIKPLKKSGENFTIHAEFVQRTFIYKEEVPETSEPSETQE
jgi:virulence-associated protein VagC